MSFFTKEMMSLYAEVDAFVGNNTFVDPDIFQLWVEGNSGDIFNFSLTILNFTKSMNTLHSFF